MAQATPRLSRSSSRRRLSGALGTILCLWLLAFATHVHAPDENARHGGGAAHLCGFCASLSVAAGIPTAARFVPAMGCDAEPAIARTARPALDPGLLPYRSRAPPAA